MVNTMENIKIKKDSFLNNILVNNSKSNGYFYKYINSSLEKIRLLATIYYLQA